MKPAKWKMWLINVCVINNFSFLFTLQVCTYVCVCACAWLVFNILFKYHLP